MGVFYFVRRELIKTISGEDLPYAAEVVFHIDIPDANNSAGVNWQDAVAKSADPQAEGIISQIPRIATDFAAQNAKLQAGEVSERMETVTYSSAYLTPAARNAEIATRAAAIETEIIGKLSEELRFFGYNNTVG